MKITRDVIQDLLPLYVAGEVSADTMQLVEKYLETDPELASIAKQTMTSDLSEIPVNLSKEVEMVAYKKANNLMVIRTLVLAAIIAGTFLATLLIVPLIYMRIF